MGRHKGCTWTDAQRAYFSKIRRGCKIKPHTKEHREALSKARIRYLMSGNGASPEYKDGWVTTRFGRHYIRSSWERKAMKMLDTSPIVENVEVEPFALKYTDHAGDVRRYIPDLLVTFVGGMRKLIEIKPSYLVGKPINIAKFRAGRKWAEENDAQFDVWTEQNLSIS